LGRADRLIDQKETIHTKYKKGCQTLKRMSNVPPKYAFPNVASEYKIKPQTRPMTFPSERRHGFLLNFPVSPKVRETKRMLKIRSMVVDSMLIRVKEAIRLRAITSRENPAIKRLIPHFGRFIPSPPYNAALRGYYR
jgi:hypothetical protein